MNVTDVAGRFHYGITLCLYRTAVVDLVIQACEEERSATFFVVGRGPVVALQTTILNEDSASNNRMLK